MGSILAGLAGLGEGATALGNSLSVENALRQERQRQAAIDALGRLKLLNDLGGSVVTPGQSIADAQDQSLMTTPGASQVLHAQSPQDVLSAGQQFMGDPSNLSTTQIPNAQGGMDTVIINPAKSAGEIAAHNAMQRLSQGKQEDYQRDLTLEQLRSGSLASSEQARQGFEGQQSAAKLAQEAAQNELNRQNALRIAKTRADAMVRARQMGLTNGQDAIKIGMVNQMAQDPIQTLTDYYQGNTNPGVVASTLGRLPVVGNMITGISDPQFANAQLAAHNLANAYAQAQPKGRGMTPQSQKMIEQLIAPELGDTPERRAQKLKTIQVFQRALQQRASTTAAGAQAFPDFEDLSGNPPENDTTGGAP